MAPRKNVDKTSSPAKTTQEKMPKKKKDKPVKPKLKAPSIIKVKLGLKKSLFGTTAPNESSPKKSPVIKPKVTTAVEKQKLAKVTRKLKFNNEATPVVPKKTRIQNSPVLISRVGVAERRRLAKASTKLELANEVALAQLVKTEVVDEMPPPEEEVQAVTKRGRKRKFILEREIKMEDVTDSVVPEPSTAKKRLRGGLPTKTIKKKPEVNKDLKVNKPATTNKRKADSTSKSVAKRPRKTQPKSVPLESPSKMNTSEKPKRTITRKGKAMDDVTSTEIQNSPSILEQDPKNHFTSKNQKKPLTRELTDEKTEISKLPELIESRKTSLSSSECFSWTKDISSSSTTTCMTIGSHFSTNDFVRFDKKMPVIKLSNIGNELHKIQPTIQDSIQENITDDEDDCNSISVNGDKSSTTSDSSSSSSSSVSSPSRSLNLSTSSITPVKSQCANKSTVPSVASEQKSSKTINILDKLQPTLNQFHNNLDIIERLMDSFIDSLEDDSENIDVNLQKLYDLISNPSPKSTKYKEEIEILKETQILKQYLSDDSTHNSISNNESSADKGPNNPLSENNFVKPVNDMCLSNGTDKSEDEEFTSTKSRYVMLDSCNDSNESLLPTQTADVDIRDDINSPLRDEYEAYEDNTHDRSGYMTLDRNYDDDDALSLFAESLTGIESIKLNSSTNAFANNSNYEEYIPQPVSKDIIKTPITYCPTKITDDEQILKTKSVCEKQNADSTSIYREPDRDKEKMEVETENNRVAALASTRPVGVPVLTNLLIKPCLLQSIYNPVQLAKSLVFKGYCFFNLISNCKKSRCNFPHETPSVDEVSCKLQKLPIDNFLQEYLLVRGWPTLRRQFGMCFVTECDRRNLTMPLVEMALDAFLKASPLSKEDTELKVNTAEIALMHLNKVNLDTCTDILKIKIGPKALCDVLMEIIAETQNFSRFKLVFIKLTDFIVQMGSRFSLNVASHILERVCILPFELPVARSLFTIIQNTDEKIIIDSMMPKFEQQLCDSDDDLYQRFLQFKRQLLEGPLDLKSSHSPSPCLSQNIEEMQSSHSDRERYTSPDTTKLENMNKPSERMIEPTVIRTMALSRPLPSLNNNFASNSSTSKSSNESEEYRPVKNHKFKQWRPNNSYNSNYHNYNVRYQSPLRPMLMRPPMQRHINQRQVSYGPTPPKFPRRSGPPDNMF